MWTQEGPRDAFVRFLLEAKRHTYASQGDEATVAPLLAGSKQLEHRDGGFSYRDIYFGMARFVGQEVVSRWEQPIWSMSYAGGVIPAARDVSETRVIYAFLRLALRQGTADRPYRGPAMVHEGPYTYTNESHGGLDAFLGIEQIARDGQKVYELYYAGGFVS